MAGKGESLEGYLKNIASARRKEVGLIQGAILLPFEPQPLPAPKEPEMRSAYKENGKYYMHFPGGEYQPDEVKEIIITKPIRNQYSRQGQSGNWKNGSSSWDRGW
mmetsp:Transcript_13874/g.33041  ORF Transcript_13874/g.33041 Transcript_13874/m.33041 type:complete len:105 (+) Transcript_13874:1-315(+)